MCQDRAWYQIVTFNDILQDMLSSSIAGSLLIVPFYVTKAKAEWRKADEMAVLPPPRD